MLKRVLQLMSVLAVSAGTGISTAGTALAAKAEPWQLGLPEPVTPLARQMGAFHDYWLLPVITVITVFVLALLLFVCFRFRESANPTPSKTVHNTMLEFAWTGVPVLILVVLAFPSLALLYETDRIEDADMTLKVVGHQWYWEYQYPEENVKFSAYLAAATHEEAEEQGVERLMTTDNEVVIPVDTKIRLQLTSADVLHNWSLSDFGVRMDTVPGRLNEAWTLVEKEGTYYGFCSELCGEGHAFMPIQVKVVSKEEYAAWVEQARGWAENFDRSFEFIDEDKETASAETGADVAKADAD